MRERGSDGMYYPIEQDEGGTYIMNSKDLMLIDHIKDMIDAGITSLKIEGRMKTAYYVASAVNAYRLALDGALAGEQFNPAWAQELEELRHRPYTGGFLTGEDVQSTSGETYMQTHEFVAVVLSYDPQTGIAHVEQRNRFYDGDELDLLTPGGIGTRIEVHGLRDEQGSAQSVAPHPQQKLFFDTKVTLKPMDILRKAVAK